MREKKIVVQSSDAGERLDTFLAKKTGITRSQIRKLIDGDKVLVRDTSVHQHYRVKTRDLITLRLAERHHEELIPEFIPIDILYQDHHLVVLNKPAGMVVYPAAGHSQGTLMNAIAHACGHLASVGGPLRPGVVHRLDKDTSGVMVVALTDAAYYNLAGQFKQRSINRRYAALVYGDLTGNEGRIVSLIGRSVSDRKKMSIRSKKGKEAVTEWTVIRRFGNVTLVRMKLGTGRTHQIRVHFASRGHPVIGDKTYGGKTTIDVKGRRKILFPRQMLHAELLGFSHPVTGEYMEFSSPLPQDMQRKIEELEMFSPRMISRENVP